MSNAHRRKGPGVVTIHEPYDGNDPITTTARRLASLDKSAPDRPCSMRRSKWKRPGVPRKKDFRELQADHDSAVAGT